MRHMCVFMIKIIIDIVGATFNNPKNTMDVCVCVKLLTIVQY